MNGKRHGTGRMTMASGKVYEGQWENSLPHGRGVEIDEEAGFRYDGEYIEGNRNGQGRLEMPGGKIYEGGFVDGVPTG